MSESADKIESLPAALACLVDERCLRFEAALRMDEQPRIIDYLDDMPVDARSILESELLSLERAYASHPQVAATTLSPLDDPAAGPADQKAATAGRTEPTDVVVGIMRLPEHIGRYRVERVLGQGGFGLVYLAHDDQLGRRVAIKVPDPDRVAADNLPSYLAEARTVAGLEHPHIVPVHDIGSTDQFPVFVVSKYIDGTDLATRLLQSPLSHVQACEWIAALAEALHYAHRMGLVHRDVKPANILIDHAGQPYLVDFGMALRDEEVGRGPGYAGTPAYMSPELV